MTSFPPCQSPVRALWLVVPLLLQSAVPLPGLGLGGGFTLGGAHGSWFANPDLAGEPVFTRREVRIDFDWGNVMGVTGSVAEPYASFPRQNFSVRWVGQVIPAFSETYTLRVLADEGARLWGRAAGTGDWSVWVDAWSGRSGQWVTAEVQLEAGAVYDIRLEYREVTGAAAVRLWWSGPSFPEEPIGPLAEIGSNVTHWGQVFADLVKGARNRWESHNNQTPGQDAEGWPTSDFSYVFQESLNMGLGVDPLALGTIGFRFRGRGDVSVWGNVDADSVVASYDPATNLTTGTFRTRDRGINASYFRVANTDRDGVPGAGGQMHRDGVADLRLMRPTAPGASTHYPFDTLFLPQIRQAYEHFTVLRSNLNNGNQERFWSDRTLPAWFNQSSGRALDRVYSNPEWGRKSNGASWEHKILLCNETGRDLYINIPHMATGWEPGDESSYVHKLARLVLFGSDGQEPYAAPQANPVFPPLNPNLRVYVELSNEVWNWGGDAFRQYWDIDQMTTLDADAALVGGVTDPLARPQDFPIINYDQRSTAKDGNGAYQQLGVWRYRKVMLRTIQISNIFRSVFGDAALHTRVRPMYEWQYANTNGTAERGLRFADEYFNNADGQAHVSDPKPLNHFLWGGGGATYYGSSNGWALTDLLADPGFEAVSLPPGYTQTPFHPQWEFSGTAGIAVYDGGSNGIPPPWNGTQMAYIAGSGQISIDVTFPTTFESNLFAVAFKAVNRVKGGATQSDEHRVRVFLDGVPINARSYNQANGYVPIPYDASRPWISRVVFWTDSAYYSTLTFPVTPGATHRLTFQGVGEADGALFLEDVRITHVDAIFDGDMPAGGSAAGQVNSSTYQLGLKIQNDWASAYGLHHITYEGGWSLGGDTGGAPIQNVAKYGSARARAINELALDIFHRVGGAVNTLGTYAQWSSWSDNYAVEGLLDLENNPLLLGQLDVLNKLRVPSSNGSGVPKRLLGADLNLSLNATTSGSGVTLPAAGAWASWNLLVPKRGAFSFEVEATGTGAYLVELNGREVVRAPAGGNLGPWTQDLLAGQQNLRLRSLGGGSLTIQAVVVSHPDFASAPSFTPRGGSFGYPVTIRLESETQGASIRYTLDGSEPTPTRGLLYTGPFRVSVDTEVRAIAWREDLHPSAVTAEFYQPAGGGEMFAAWDFSGQGGVSVSSPNYNLMDDPEVVARIGPGLQAGNYLGNGLTATRSTALTLAQAVVAEDYLSIRVQAGDSRLLLSRLEFRPVSQNRPRTFTLFSSVTGFAPEQALGSAVYHGNNGPEARFGFDLAGHEDVPGPVEFRLYVHGFDNSYEAVGLGNRAGVDLVVYGRLALAANRLSWAQTRGLAWDPLMDHDGDGLPMLLEYALGGDPLVAGSANLPQGVSLAGDVPRFSFPRLGDRTDLRYILEVSGDLATWTEVARSVAGAATESLLSGIGVEESGTGPVSVEVTLGQRPFPVFLRLRVEVITPD